MWNSPGLNAPGCASCPSDVTQICFTGRFWNPSADPVCSTAVRRGANAGEGRQVKISRFRKEKGIPVCHTWRLSAFQNMWEGTTVTGRPIARLKSRKQKDSSSFPDHIQTSKYRALTKHTALPPSANQCTEAWQLQTAGCSCSLLLTKGLLAAAVKSQVESANVKILPCSLTSCNEASMADSCGWFLC